MNCVTSEAGPPLFIMTTAPKPVSRSAVMCDTNDRCPPPWETTLRPPKVLTSRP